MYLLISLTGYSGIKADPRRIVFGGLFVIGLLLNVLWTIVFTYQQNITGGFIIIIILDVVVLTQIIYLLTCKNKPARVTGGLLVIYLIWLAYATSLNGSIMLNQ